MEERYKELKQGERGAQVSLVAYIILAILKLTVGIYAGSVALRADGLNNVTDVVVAIAVLIGLRVSQKPPDKDHPYGHWKAETVASLVASFIIMVVGIQVIIDAITSVFTGTSEPPNIIAAWVGAFGFVVMFAVYLYTKKLAKRINSHAVESVSKDNLSDALVSAGATLGIIGSQFGLPWLDPLLAFVVGVIICHTAWGIFSKSSLSLTDGVDDKTLDDIKETALAVAKVNYVTDVKARYYGSNLIVDLVIQLDHSLSFTEAHDVSTIVEDQITEKHRTIDVHVHVEPEGKTNHE
ncbi:MULTISPECIES: cation diffusion facilitator family transporter [Shouchella]|uniref:Cation diffusion facilitator family transporter n=2 Tax=Shouchella TaxID=2893057 RepID=A0ABY7W751_9BACI|nr:MULTISPECIES: cation diffusion facilitator family transporter [Shouchella]MED4126529.1 cation diffusion facilitator family transporter [Shouchella miscanthi]WDF04763.1 cation diffusion facilitator family transporter [Shouchella hunanensis]